MKATGWLFAACLACLVSACSDDDEEGNSATAESAAGSAASTATGKPASDATAYLGAGGIGVTDLDASQAFYAEVFGMSLRYALPVPGYVDERILYFKDGNKGSDVVLMHYTDGREHNYKGNPVRLVFYVPNAKTVVEAIRARGLRVITEPAPMAAFNNTVIGFGLDPDGYGLEIIEASTLTQPYLGAIGLGVADLDKAKAFYTGVLGMEQMGDPISVPNVWDELIFRYPSGKGSSVVVMHYTDGREHNYLNNPVKSVHFVADSKALTGKVEQAGLPILSQPNTFEVMGTKALIGLARDPDGYTVEMVTTQ